MTDPQIEIRRLARLVPAGDTLYVPPWDLQRYARAHALPIETREIIVEGITVRVMEVLDPIEGVSEETHHDEAEAHHSSDAADAFRYFVEAIHRSRRR